MEIAQVGATLAERIIRARPFTDWNEVRRVPQMGQQGVANLARKFYIGRGMAEYTPTLAEVIWFWRLLQETLPSSQRWTPAAHARDVERHT